MADIAATRCTEQQVLLIGGPRSVVSRRSCPLVTGAGVEVIDLDDLDAREAVSRDLQLFAAGDPPVCFGEYQKVPLVLDAIEAELNHSGRPGRFVLAGSTRFDALRRAPDGGAVTHRPPAPAHPSALLPGRARPVTSRARRVIRRVTTGGFPLAVGRPTTAARNRWFDGHVRLTLERDVRDLSRVRQAAARLLRLTPEKLGRRSTMALQQFGHLLDTFAVMEVVEQASWRGDIDGLHHWRTHDRFEVDLVVERDDGTVIGTEIKAGGRLPGDDFRGLRALRDQIGEQFVAGYALYLGERAHTYEDRLHVLPLDRLWTA